MIKQINKRRAAAFIFAALLIMTAIICRRCVYIMEKRSVLAHVLDFVRSSCYLVLYSFWAISLEQRIIHKQTRKILVGIALLAARTMGKNEELQTYNEVLQEDVRQRAKRLIQKYF